jgi:hypothetical protein
MQIPGGFYFLIHTLCEFWYPFWMSREF